MTIPQKPLGSQGLITSQQGLGCMGMSMFYTHFKQPDEETKLAVIKRAHELGVTMLDSADMYDLGENERLIESLMFQNTETTLPQTSAKPLQPKPSGAKTVPNTVVTNFGNVRSKEGAWSVRGDREHVRAACEKSFKDLGVDTIDLYYQHRVDPNTPIEDTVKAMAMEWSLFTRDIENDVVPTCRELGIGIVAYSPLGRGFLTGGIKSRDDLPADDSRRSHPRWSEENFDKNIKLVHKVKEIAAQKGVSPGQIALAWLHAQGEDVFPIPGTTKIHRLEENVAAYDLKLTKQDLDALEAAFPHGAIIGNRYNDHALKATYGQRL